eukprot:CAMPEP_0181054030 /NCGR_PEP_ID=MMETSP1070-20121207/18453_1 /TAXON_ID=265543 /ORGANISM="Minutocellus polymorphus, Strain NH13" /LENGTH=593 /DNA_ID=CAMNT_0023133257 /DNA_START=136 /DNA_END=1917 /DNA_ORIENTATION=+
MAASPSSNANTGVDLSSYVRGRPATTSSTNSSTTSNRVSASSVRKAPIYVPIGPPCAGKTTVLSRILAPKNATVAAGSNNHHPTVAGRTAGRDISIDDQEGVYLQVPTRLFLVSDPKTSRPKSTSPDGRLLNRTVYGKTIYERLYSDGNNDEIRAVLQRLAGRLAKAEFRETIMRQMNCWKGSKEVSQPGEIGTSKEAEPFQSVGRHGGPNQISSALMAQYLIDAVEHYAETETLTSSGHLRDANHPILGPDGCSDLFVLEAIFRSTDVVQGGRSRRMPSGLNLALSLMERLACNPSALTPNEPLAWGNTNTRPREYTSALEVAQKSGRPVVFIPHVNPSVVSVEGGGGAGPGNGDIPSEFLHHVKLDELYRRSIGRLVHTGRYVPAAAIKDATFRCDSLMLSAKAEMSRLFPASQDELDAGDEVKIGSTREDDATAAITPTRTFTKLQLEMSLCKMAGYQMNADRMVRKLSREDNGADRGGGRGRGRGPGNGRGPSSSYDVRGGRGGRGYGGRGNGGRGYDDDRSGDGRSWNGRQGQHQQGYGSGGRAGDSGWNLYGRNDQQKRSYDGSRQWSPSRQQGPPYDGNRTLYNNR